MKKSKFLTLPLVFLLASCVKYNGMCKIHTDVEGDGFCDICGYIIGDPCEEHADKDGDRICDSCGAYIKTQEDYEKEQHQEATKKVTTYLVLSSVGLYKGEKGKDIEEKYLENAIEFVAKPGTKLPGRDDVTHMDGKSVFSQWIAYENQGAPKVYTTVPNKEGTILYPTWISDGSSSEIVVPEGHVEMTLKVKFDGGDWSSADAAIYAYCESGSANQAYLLSRKDETTFSYVIQSNTYNKVTFYRFPASTAFAENGWWNKSVSLTMNSNNRDAQIDGWDTDSSGICPASWIK